MKEGWVTRPLGECCQIKPPKREARNRLSQEDLVSFVPMNDLGIREKWLKPSEERLFEAVAGSYTYFADGDVLLAKITPCFENGKLGIARGLTNGTGFGSSEFIVLRPNDSLDVEFLFYFLSQDGFRDAGAAVMSGAVGHKRVPSEFVQNTKIPVPTLPEQKRIVAILDEAFAGIATAVANTERNLANTRELFESYLNSVFRQASSGWSRFSLESLTQDNSAITYGVVKPGPEGDVRFVRGGDISKGEIEIDRLRTITRRVSDQYRRTLLRGGEIVMCLVGVPGQTAVVPSQLAGANIARQVGLVRLKSEINPHFVSMFLRSRIGLESLGAYTGGSVQQVINLRDLRKVEVPLPGRVEQDRIVGRLHKIAERAKLLEEKATSKLGCLAELKQSLLQKAFSGDLTAKPRDELEAALA